MVRVLVYGSDGRGLSGAQVHISWYGGGHSSGRTDSNGYIDFNNVGGGTGKIYVEGKEVFDGKVEGLMKVPRLY